MGTRTTYSVTFWLPGPCAEGERDERTKAAAAAARTPPPAWCLRGPPWARAGSDPGAWRLSGAARPSVSPGEATLAASEPGQQRRARGDADARKRTPGSGARAPSAHAPAPPRPRRRHAPAPGPRSAATPSPSAARRPAAQHTGRRRSRAPPHAQEPAHGLTRGRPPAQARRARPPVTSPCTRRAASWEGMLAPGAVRMRRRPGPRPRHHSNRGGHSACVSTGLVPSPGPGSSQHPAEWLTWGWARRGQGLSQEGARPPTPPGRWPGGSVRVRAAPEAQAEGSHRGGGGRRGGGLEGGREVQVPRPACSRVHALPAPTLVVTRLRVPAERPCTNLPALRLCWAWPLQVDRFPVLLETTV